MSNRQENVQPEMEPSPRIVPFDLRLGNIKSTKNTFARILREYGKGNIPDKAYRSLVWGLSQYSGILKMHTEGEILERLEVLEKARYSNAE